MYYLCFQFLGCLCMCVAVSVVTLRRVRKIPLSTAEKLLLITAFVLMAVPAVLYAF